MFQGLTGVVPGVSWGVPGISWGCPGISWGGPGVSWGVPGVSLHLGAELQLGQQRPQDLDLPLQGEHKVQPIVELHDFPHLDSVVLVVLLVVLHVVLREPVHRLGVSHSVRHVVILLVRLVRAGAVVVSPRLVLLVHGVHLGAEHQLGQRLPQDFDLPRHAELVLDLKLLLLA